MRASLSRLATLFYVTPCHDAGRARRVHERQRRPVAARKAQVRRGQAEEADRRRAQGPRQGQRQRGAGARQAPAREARLRCACRAEGGASMKAGFEHIERCLVCKGAVGSEGICGARNQLSAVLSALWVLPYSCREAAAARGAGVHRRAAAQGGAAAAQRRLRLRRRWPAGDGVRRRVQRRPPWRHAVRILTTADDRGAARCTFTLCGRRRSVLHVDVCSMPPGAWRCEAELVGAAGSAPDG